MKETNLEDITADHLLLYQKDVEIRFIEQCLNHCKGMIQQVSISIDKGEIEPETATILQLIYILDYAKEFVGPSRGEEFLKSDILSRFQPMIFYKEWDFDDINKKINFIIEKIAKNENQFKFEKKIARINRDRLVEDLIDLWPKFNYADKTSSKKRIRLDLKKKYDSIGSDIDRSRRSLVRKLIDHPKFKEVTKYEKIFSLCLAYNNACLNKCRHCMARRPMKKRFLFDKTKIDSILSAASKYGIEILLFTGGEPFLSLDEMTYTIEHGDFSQIFITTSGNFAVDTKKGGQTDITVGKIWSAFCSNKNNRKLGIGLQISLDKFHQEIFRNKDDTLRENSSLFKIANLMEVIFRDYHWIRITLMSVRCGKQNSILKYLINELERRKIECVGKEDVLSLYDLLIGEAPQKGPEILQTEIEFKFDDKKIKVYCGAQLISRVGEAVLLPLWESMDSAYTLEDFEQMKEPDKLALESNMLLTEGDGNVYLGGSLAGIWALSNLENEDMFRIIECATFDPLVYAINNHFGQLVRWAKEVDPSLEHRISSHPTGMEVLNKILDDAYMRLYLTKRAMIEGGYPTEIMEELGLKVSLSNLKNEYLTKTI